MYRQHFKQTRHQKQPLALQNNVGYKNWYHHKALCLFRWALFGPVLAVHTFFPSDEAHESQRQPE